jgi:hypothetical protein
MLIYHVCLTDQQSLQWKPFPVIAGRRLLVFWKKQFCSLDKDFKRAHILKKKKKKKKRITRNVDIA